MSVIVRQAWPNEWNRGPWTAGQGGAQEERLLALARAISERL